MKLATRINSFLPVNDNDMDKVFGQFQKLGLGYVDLNFPEHTKNFSPEEMKSLLEKHNLKANGVALRFKDDYTNGDLGNEDDEVANKALELCKSAADYCRAIGGHVVTIWEAHDGFDYNFQIDYLKVWNRLKDSFQEIADYAPDLKISIEYKPFQPRAYAFIDSMGVTIGVWLKTKNSELRSFSLTGLVTIALSAIIEPTLFGLLVKNRKIWLAQIIGGAVGGAYLAVMHVATNAFVFGSITTFPAFIMKNSNNFIQAMIGLLISLVVGAILAYFFTSRDEKLA